MSPGVPDHVIERIVRAVDFPALVSRYSNVEKKGNRYWALCPFHNEKTPSFSIDAERGLYYCFGCKEGGNVFTFLQKIEGLDFGQALEKLAAETGVELKGVAGEWQKSRARGEELRRANELAVAFYTKCLEKAGGGDSAASYLEQRGISSDSAEQWRLGYAPDGWDHFLKFARGRQFEPELLERAGLIKPRRSGKGYIDRFRNRLMFPIEDRMGRAIGFGARALEEDDEPKYLNSPETPLFSKGTCFYGLPHARDAIRAEKTAVVVEGYTDAIMCHQFGFENVLGVLGTALTEEHARTLGRLCDSLVLVFDADEAGQKSARRSIEVLLAEDLDVSVASLPEDMDPCDMLVEEGAESFRRVLEDTEDFLDFALRLAGGEHDLQTVSGRKAFFRDVADLAVSAGDTTTMDFRLRRISQKLDLTGASVWHSIRKEFLSGNKNRRSEAFKEGFLSQVREASVSFLGLLLVNPRFQRSAAERINLQVLEEADSALVLRRLLESCHKRQEGIEAEEFISLLRYPEESSLAAGAVVREEKAQASRANRSPEERFDLYMDFFEEKQREREIQELSPTTTTRSSGEEGSEDSEAPSVEKGEDDDELRAYYQRLKERDRKKSHER